MTENYLPSSLLSLNGINMFKERLTLSPSSPTIRTCPTLKTLVNSLANKPAGLFSTRLRHCLDALSHYNQVDTSLDNVDTAIIPLPAVINILDLTLAHYIQSSSSTDPLVLRAIQNLSDDTPLFPRSLLADWTVDNGHLYIKDKCTYVPPPTWSSLLHSIHSAPHSGHLGQFRTKAIVERDFWWPGLSMFVNNFITGCAVCQ